MTKKVIFSDSFLVSGIMCHQGCGAKLQEALANLQDLKISGLLPEDAEILPDAEPEALGLHRFRIQILAEECQVDAEAVSRLLRAKLTFGRFTVLDDNPVTQTDGGAKSNWMNITLNILMLCVIIFFTLLFPPSLPLTLSLTALTFVTTAITSRAYLFSFFQNLRQKKIFNMSTPVSAGWALSLIHTVYHNFHMPVIHTFSMTFMNFMMPVMLISFVNVMDEIRRLVIKKSARIHIRGMKGLFPQMSENYICHELTPDESGLLGFWMKMDERDPEDLKEFMKEVLQDERKTVEAKSALQKGMIITVKKGECFPVDGIIVHGSTLIDASLLTGEHEQQKRCLDHVPAGAINLGGSVTVFATQNSYNSTVNKLLFRSNRAGIERVQRKTERGFLYLYAALTVLGLVCAVAVPFGMGIASIPLLLQNLTGILFAICPCTITIAHTLPRLLSFFQRAQKGILLRQEHLVDENHPIHTVVFDKTGTLTTGNSQVYACEGISDELWERIYLLEKETGAGHPLAKAITRFYEAEIGGRSYFDAIAEESSDPDNRGLSALVQGRRVCVGNADYLKEVCKVTMPVVFSPAVQDLLEQGYTPVHVAEDGVYAGVIFIRHEIRNNILTDLQKLKRQGVKIIMLTGDSEASAMAFNRHHGSIFKNEDIYAAQTPHDKERFLSNLMQREGVDPKGVRFVCDGLNDAPSARIVSEKGGISCAMNSEDKSVFFSDMCLGGSLKYLFCHHKLNRFLKKNIRQNQWIIALSSVVFLVFVLFFSVSGLAVPALAPLGTMLLTTGLTLFNSWRVNLFTDKKMDEKISWMKRCLSSDFTLYQLLAGSALLAGALVLSAAGSSTLVASGILTLALTVSAVSCLGIAGLLFGAFILVAAAYFLVDVVLKSEKKAENPQEHPGVISLVSQKKGEHAPFQDSFPAPKANSPMMSEFENQYDGQAFNM